MITYSAISSQDVGELFHSVQTLEIAKTIVESKFAISVTHHWLSPVTDITYWQLVDVYAYIDSPTGKYEIKVLATIFKHEN